MTSAEYSAPVFSFVQEQHITKDPTINLAIGPSCPVRCEGCYNHFGDTVLYGGIITADEVLDFADAAVSEGITQATLSCGDPLFHPEIVSILDGLKAKDLTVKLDTVGTLFLDNAPIIFKGKGLARRVSVDDIAQSVDYVNIPLDGASQPTVNRFRKGRPNLFNETRLVAGLLRDAGISFGYNTVANKSNLQELADIQATAIEDKATEWQVFEYDPTGPNPSRQKSLLALGEGQFEEYTRQLVTLHSDLKITCKSLSARSGVYFLIDDSGQAWKPAHAGSKQELGHITLDRENVITALHEHIKQFRSPE